jgi:hypothetical protein
MKKKTIHSFLEYIEFIERTPNLGSEIILFRGQPKLDPLLPQIARDNPNINTVDLEIKMLEALRRRSPLLINREFNNDWEWLILSQHYGMKTRLLDWSSNPLVALWFACYNPYFINENSYVYILIGDKSMQVDYNSGKGPFDTTKTKILRPKLNNERIVAQFGWFTAHMFSISSKKFVKLETNADVKDKLIEIKIPAEIKADVLSKLSIMGINNRTIFPDISGLCKHLNWKYIEKKSILNK